MNWNQHSELEGQHAYLGASKYHWLNYDEEKLEGSYRKFQAAQKGTVLHKFAFDCIKLGIKLPKSKKALNAYVNDAIGFRMTPEQIVYYSRNSFGTADAISFRDKTLRIHDLKTGVTSVSMMQLIIYAALFCLEYTINPADIRVELRIYQNDSVVIHSPQPEEILEVMGKIILFDKKIEKLRLED